MFIGIDVGEDASGDLDLFIGLDDKNGQQTIGFYGAGSGANTGPSTTTIDSIFNNGTTLVPDSFEQGVTDNYDWQAVTAIMDPTATSFNVDNGTASGQTDPTDHFLSFKFDFSELVLAFAEVGILGITDQSEFSFVAATATQDNSLNQDLNGVNGGLNSPLTWDELDASSPAARPGEVPEPATYALLMGFLAFAGVLVKRRR